MKIKFKHTYIVIPPSIEFENENRRFTICTVEDGKRTLVGQSICHPKDQFCKAIGRKVALADAIRGLSKETRKTIWDEYHSKFKVPNAK